MKFLKFVSLVALLASPVFGQGKSAGVNGEGIDNDTKRQNFRTAIVAPGLSTNNTFSGTNTFGNITQGTGTTFNSSAVNVTIANPTQWKTAFLLQNVDNTSDLNKPISTATQTALNLKANANNAVLTGSVTVPDGALAIADTNLLQAALDAKQATLVSGTNIKTVDGQSLLGSGNVATVAGGNTPFLVTTYGADPTGVADSTAAFAAALTAASTGNRWVHFPRGAYKGNIVLTAALSTGHWKFTGDGAGSTGDWSGVEAAGATLVRANNDAEPILKIEKLVGVTVRGIDFRGNGAGVTADGILIDHPSVNFAGNGLYVSECNIRACTNGFRSVGGCNVVFRDSSIVNNNVQINIPLVGSPFAHSYRFEQCSLGGLATYFGGSGASRILQVGDGSFIDLLGCEMGNCTDMFMGAATGATVVNVIGGNMETMSASVLNTMYGGHFNMTGVRIGTGNKVVLRAIGGTGEILGVALENNFASGTMTMFDHYGIGYARVAGNGLNKIITEYTDNTFTVVRGTSVCERIVASTRLTANVTLPAGTTTLVCGVADKNVGSKYNTTTGEMTPGKRGDYVVSAMARLNGSVPGSVAKLHVFVNGSNRGTLASVTTGGAGTTISGSYPVTIAAGDIITVRVELGTGGVEIGNFDNYTTRVAFVEQGYWN